MIHTKARGILLAWAAAAAVLGAPAESSACQCLDWVWPWNWGRGQAAASTTYAPPYVPSAATVAPVAASAYGSCATQTCAYVPQTCYRTVYQTVPVTTCQAVNYSDPCTGCPVTAYRPVTSYVQSAQLVPYTTYRMVWTNGLSTGCSPCGTASYAPMSTVGSGCSSCAGPTSNVGSSSAAPPSLSPTPEPSSSMPSNTFATPPSAAPAGVPAPGPSSSQGRAVQREPLAPIAEDEQAAPIPPAPVYPPTDKPTSMPNLQLFDPSNRTTARPIRQASYTAPASESSLPLDNTGWRASRD